MKSGKQEHFTDEQAKAILARAIELDARAPTTMADELAEASAVAEGGRWGRVVRRLFGWITRPLRHQATYLPFAGTG